MKKGLNFSRNGRLYEVLQDGLEFVETQKNCIRPKGSTKCITIHKALKQSLIREMGKPQDTEPEETENLLFPSFTNKMNQTKESHKKEDPNALNQRQVQMKPASAINATLFMPLDQLRAQVFLAHGLIYPAMYDMVGFSNGFDDMQNSDPASLALYAGPMPIKKNQLIFKIRLNANEIENSDSTTSDVRLVIPIPISRLEGIEVSSEVGDIKRYIDGWVKPDVPVPRHLFAITQTTRKPSSESLHPEIRHNNAKQIAGIEESIIKFDRYMGLLAFCRNAARYFSVRTGWYADYPEGFLSLCAEILKDPSVSPNNKDEAEPLLMALLDYDTQLTEPIKAVLALAKSTNAYIDKDQARPLAMEIYKVCDENESLRLAFKTLFSGDYRSAIQELQKPEFPIEAGVLAALFKYSGRQSNDHRTIKQLLHEDWFNYDQITPVLGAIGAYYGYTALDAKETNLYSVHLLLKPLIKNNPDIKFHMNTLFERQIIEALYQKAFYNRPPDKSMDHFYNSFPTNAPNLKVDARSNLIKDKSYRVRDLIIKRYEVTIIGRIIQRLRGMNREMVDEQCEVGKYLLSQCIFFAEEFEMSRKSGRDTLRFRISKERLVDLLASGRISVNHRMMETALKEDEKR
jgi:hypothetical protein